MKIAIDLVQMNRDGAGISYVMKGLVRGAIENPEHEFLLVFRGVEVLSEALPEVSSSLPDHVSLLVMPTVPKWRGGGLGWYRKLAKSLKSKGVDALISPTLSPVSIFYDRNVQIVNDLSPLNSSFYFSKFESFKFGILLDRAKDKAWKIVTISEATKSDFLERYPDYQRQIEIIPLGLNAWVHTKSYPLEAAKVLDKHGIKKPYFLSVSTIQPRKNYERMITAFAQFAETNPSFTYVIVGGKGWYYEPVFELVKKLGLEHKVKFLGYTADEDMPHIHDEANSMLYVSLEEGFGLPVIEANSRALPILASDIPVFSEIDIPSEMIEFVSPLDTGSIAAGMSIVSSKSHLKPDPILFEKYSWGNCVKVLAEITSRNG